VSVGLDRRVPVAGHMDIEIEGVATIRIDAADGGKLAETGRRRSDAASAIDALIAEMGAGDLQVARARAALRARLADDLAQGQAKLSGIAPHGRAAIVAEIARLEGELEGEPEALSSLPPKSGLSLAKLETAQKLQDLKARRAELETSINDAGKTLAGLEAEAGARLNRMAALAQGLPPPEVRAETLAGLDHEHSAALAAVETARLTLNRIASAAVADAPFRDLTGALEEARQAMGLRETECQALVLDIEKLKSEQSAVDEDGRAGQVGAAEDEFNVAALEVTRLEREVKALVLLQRTLNMAEENARAHYLEPVTRRLAPYLARVFPDAGLEFKGTFSLDALVRAGQREDFASLSDGTREQLAVLVRMGFARLIAERGSPAPLILDDPLVYSDDERLAAMHRALEDAGAVHQVIVLTCREAAFSGLAGRRLWIETWQPDSR
jgi:hypothetical protein